MPVCNTLATIVFQQPQLRDLQYAVQFEQGWFALWDTALSHTGQKVCSLLLLQTHLS